MPIDTRALQAFTLPQLPAIGAVETRAAAPFEVNIPGLFGRSNTKAWRPASVREALSVPAFYRAVALISNTAGVLSMDAYQRGRKLEAEARPRLIVRPNPLTVPRTFYRDTAFYMATRGETWWWVAVRFDGLAQSLVPVPPWEVQLRDSGDARYPDVYWRDKKMPQGDMRQIVMLPDPDHPGRGYGPLQACGAAVSVAVEAQDWAANFYIDGGYPSIYLKSDYDFADEDEPEKIKAKWTEAPANTPRVLSPGLTPGTLPVNEQGAQMLTSREYSVGDAARAFGIPGSLLDHAASGSSLTYQNVGDEFDKFVRSCLWPDYLEGIEQEMTDLLPRAITATFNLKALLRPDPKTRAEVHKLNIESGVYDSAYAQVEEGIEPGSIETAPMPPAVPAATPGPIETRSAAQTPVSVAPVRCSGLKAVRRNGMPPKLVPCNRILAERAPFYGTCGRCGKHYGEAVA